jgi:hypothetical protein
VDVSFYRLDQRPDLVEAALDLNDRVWPKFIDSTPSGIRFWECLYDEFAHLQVIAVNDEHGLVACGHTIPLWWDGSIEGLPVGWDDMLAQGVLRMRAGAAVNTLAGLAVTVDPSHQRTGLSPRVIKEMANVAADYNHKSLIVAVRPTLKSDHPMTSMEEYITWKNDKGEPYDPWIRIHLRVGAKLLGVANHSMVVEAPISDWEDWTGLNISSSEKEVIIPRALVPALIDQENSYVRYFEPNVWVKHTISSKTDI